MLRRSPHICTGRQAVYITQLYGRTIFFLVFLGRVVSFIDQHFFEREKNLSEKKIHSDIVA